MARYLVEWGSISVGSGAKPKEQEKSKERKERRKWKRFKVAFKTVVNLHGLSEIANAVDLSIGGIRLTGDVPLTFWDSVRLEFVLPAPSGPIDIRVIGRVKRVIKDDEVQGFGIEYEMMPPEARKALADYLEYLDKRLSVSGDMEITRNNSRT